MTKFRVSLALAAALILSACYPTVTSHPVGTTVGIKNDPALAGTWKTVPQPGDKGYAAYFHFLTRGADGYIAIVVPASGRASDTMIATVSTARFGSFGFLNAKLAEADGQVAPGQPPGTVPVLYRFGPKGTLSLFLPDDAAVKAAIRAHKIAGDAGKKTGDDVTITADARTLDKFLASPAGQALFTKPFGVMRKVD